MRGEALECSARRCLLRGGMAGLKCKPHTNLIPMLDELAVPNTGLTGTVDLVQSIP
jgi:hypothetical protein